MIKMFNIVFFFGDLVFSKHKQKNRIHTNCLSQLFVESLPTKCGAIRNSNFIDSKNEKKCDHDFDSDNVVGRATEIITLLLYDGTSFKCAILDYFMNYWFFFPARFVCFCREMRNTASTRRHTHLYVQ